MKMCEEKRLSGYVMIRKIVKSYLYCENTQGKPPISTLHPMIGFQFPFKVPIYQNPYPDSGTYYH